MPFWWDEVLAFTALEQVGSLLASAAPAWVWSREDGRFLWANVPAGQLTGFSRLQNTVQHQWPMTHPLRRSLNGLAGSQPAAGAASAGALTRLRVGNSGSDVPLTCRISTVRAHDMRGLLIVAESERRTPDLDELATFLSARGLQALIEEASGRVVASGDDDIGGDARTTRAASFQAGVQHLRLRFAVSSAAIAEPIQPRAEPPILRSAAETDPSSPGPASARRSLEPDRSAPDLDIVELQAAVVGVAAERIAAEKGRRDRRRTDPLQPESARELPVAPEASGAAGRQPAPVAANDGGAPRPLTVGRVAQPLPRQPVRFLWQTDGAGRFLFVSPGLAQIVGRNADVIGETWPDIASRLKLDPEGRIDGVLGGDGTWSGLTAWWPVEGSNVRVPVELTALPIFGADRSFQGFRGFGVLKPAEALMPAAFEVRFRGASGATEPTPPYEESTSSAGNVVALHGDRPPDGQRLTAQERSAFEEIAAALRDRVVERSGENLPDGVGIEPEASRPVRGVASPAAPVQAALPSAPPPSDRLPSRDLSEPENNRTAATPAPVDRGHLAKPVVRRPEPRPPATGRTRAHQVQTEAGLMTGEAPRLAALLDLSRDGVLFLDGQGDVISAGRAAEAMLGLTASELRGTPVADLFTMASGAALLGDLAALRSATGAGAGRRTRTLEAAIGESVTSLEVTLGSLTGSRDICVLLRDLSTLNGIEADLAEAREAAELGVQQRSELLFHVAQEIREPLDGLIALTEFAQSDDRNGPSPGDRLRDVRAAAASVGRVVDGLLDLARIDVGKLDVAFGAVSLNDLVRESIGLMQPQAGKARVVLRSSTARDAPSVVADQRMLQQAVLNLLSNSIRLTGPGGQVIASTSLLESGEALLRVRDAGDHPPEYGGEDTPSASRQSRLSSDTDMTGTRPGLSMTRALVEANRASMSLRSTPGEGTVVTVAFPPTRVLSE